MMFSILKNRLGVPGVISVIALVFALMGGAYAASSGSGGKATASAKGKRGPRGPKGATGPTGPAGPQSPAGAKGDAGANGAAGAAGDKGATGATGATGPTGAAGATGATGATGPTGATGASGPEGSPWTAGGVLPPGKTETGSWGSIVSPEPDGVTEEFSSTSGAVAAPVSFTLPLSAPLDAAHVISVPSGGPVPSECDDGQGEASSRAHPEADPGFLCVYPFSVLPDAILRADNPAAPGASRSGAIVLKGEMSWASPPYVGTFAVTAQ